MSRDAQIGGRRPDGSSLWARMDPGNRPFVALGGSAIVAGGLVATVNSAAPFENGSWAAAYLVLVAGVAQLVLALGRRPASRRRAHAELALWNAGNAGVLGGTLAGLPLLVSVAGVLLLAALACFAGDGFGDSGRGAQLYRLALVALASSVVVGGVLAWVG